MQKLREHKEMGHRMVWWLVKYTTLRPSSGKPVLALRPSKGKLGLAPSPDMGMTKSALRPGMGKPVWLRDPIRVSRGGSETR